MSYYDFDPEFVQDTYIRAGDTSVLFEAGVQPAATNGVTRAFESLPKEFQEILSSIDMNAYISRTFHFEEAGGIAFPAAFFTDENNKITGFREQPYIMIDASATGRSEQDFFEITVHELWHTVDLSLTHLIAGKEEKKNELSSGKKWKDLFDRESGSIAKIDKAASINVQRSPREMLAETMRIMISNPEALQKAAPETYRYLAAEITKYREMAAERMPEIKKIPHLNGGKHTQEEQEVLSLRKFASEKTARSIVFGDPLPTAEEIAKIKEGSEHLGFTFHIRPDEFKNCAAMIMNDTAFSLSMQVLEMDLKDGTSTTSIGRFMEACPEERRGVENHLKKFEPLKAENGEMLVFDGLRERKMLTAMQHVGCATRKLIHETGAEKEFFEKDKEIKQKADLIFEKILEARKEATISDQQLLSLRKDIGGLVHDTIDAMCVLTETKGMVMALRDITAAISKGSHVTEEIAKYKFWKAQEERLDEKAEPGKISSLEKVQKNRILTELKKENGEYAIATAVRKYSESMVSSGRYIAANNFKDAMQKTECIINGRLFDQNLTPVILRHEDMVQCHSLQEIKNADIVGKEYIALQISLQKERLGRVSEHGVFMSDTMKETLGIGQSKEKAMPALHFSEPESSLKTNTMEMPKPSLEFAKPHNVPERENSEPDLER